MYAHGMLGGVSRVSLVWGSINARQRCRIGRYARVMDKETDEKRIPQMVWRVTNKGI